LSATPKSANQDPSIPKAPAKAESEKVTWKKDNGAKSCHVKAGADLSASVAAMSGACVAKTMHKLGQTNLGQGSPDKMVTSVPLKAEANHCYRVLGIAESTVTDLDIAVVDSAGKSIGEDLNDSNDAVVLEDGAFCFKEADTVNVNVAVANGSGKWAFEVWSD
jgi:hypothetical protein